MVWSRRRILSANISRRWERWSSRSNSSRNHEGLQTLDTSFSEEIPINMASPTLRSDPLDFNNFHTSPNVTRSG